MPSETTSLALRPKPALLTGVESFVRQWWPVGLFSVLWLDLIRQLSYQWSTNEQYAYGWFVPLLALGLFVKKWPTRPRDRSQSGAELLKPIAALPEEPENPWALGIPIPWSNGLVVRWNFVVTTFVAFAALLILPVRVVYEANPDWPLCSWLLALGVVTISLYAVFLLGGWSWVAHFAFPVCFILVAVRWPDRIERNLTNDLMRAVAGITTQVLGWVDVMAFAHGRVIELSTGTVGINEACSGIRSFQSTLMGALFLGELYRLVWRQRLWLLVGGVALSFCLNVVRTLVLTWYASDAGIEAAEKWHDPAGFSIFLASLLCLWLLAWRLRKSEVQSPTSNVQSPVVSGPWSSGLWSGSQWSVVRSQWSAVARVPSPNPKNLCPSVSICGRVFRLRPRPFRFLLSAFCFLLSSFSSLASPRRFLIAVGCWSVCILGLNEFWYYAHEQGERPDQQWSASLPLTNATFQPVDIPSSARALMRNDSSITGTWKENDGSEWTVFFLRWNAKSMPSVMRARTHRPEVCLPMAGFREISISTLEYFQAGAFKLPFRKYIYEANGKILYVFFCLWQDGDDQQQGKLAKAARDHLGIADRLDWARRGRRRLGQQTTEIVLSGYTSLQEAEKEVRRRLPQLIRVAQRESEGTGSQGSRPTT